MKVISYLEGISERKNLVIVLFVAIFAIVPIWMNYSIIQRDGVHRYIPVVQCYLSGDLSLIENDSLWTKYPFSLYEEITYLTVLATGFEPETSARLVSAIFYVLGALGIYLLTRLAFKDKITALICVLFYVANRRLLSVSDQCLKETLLLAMAIWGNLLIFLSLEQSRRWLRAGLSLLGVLVLLGGILVRETSAVFIVLWCYAWAFKGKDGKGMDPVKPMVLTGLLCAFLLLSFFKGDWMLFSKTLRLRWYFLDLMTTYPGPLDVVMAAGTIIYDFFYRTQVIFALLGIIGLYVFRSSRYAVFSLGVLLLFFFVFLTTGWHYTGKNASRYLLVPIVLLFPVSAAYANRLIRSEGAFGKWAAVLTIAACPLVWGTLAFRPPEPGLLARKDAGAWILSQAGAGRDILTNREEIVYYARGNTVDIMEQGSLEDPSNIVAVRQPKTFYLRLSSIASDGKLTMIAAVDAGLEDGKRWVDYLEKKQKHPIKRFRSIYVYFPDRP